MKIHQQPAPLPLTGAILALGIGLGWGLAGTVYAESFTSSASSAASTSSASISTSLDGSSDSSSHKEKTAAGDYRITEVAQAPGGDGLLRVKMRTDASAQTLALNLPKAIFQAQALQVGDVVRVERPAYGFAFARTDTHEPFYLVLADDWHGELAARPVTQL